MERLIARRPLIAAAVFCAVLPSVAAPPNTAKAYVGKVVPLTTALEKFGAKLDRDAAPFWLALVTDDGAIYPLVKDDGGRRFFKDERLRNRPMRITGRLFGDTSLLQVLSVRSRVNGKWYEPFYWCDVCAIKRPEMMDCDCCGAPMVFREEPADP